jgi:hypothetical protein
MASGEMALAPCPTCSKLISVEAYTCPYCDLRITEATKSEMLQVARFQVKNNRTKNGLWIAETRKHEVIPIAKEDEVILTARVKGKNASLLAIADTYSWWKSQLNNASKLRDFGLVVIAGTYALGFIIWSFHAVTYNLGLLPIIDSQYFIAGILPFIFSCIGGSLVYLLIRIAIRHSGGRLGYLRLIVPMPFDILFTAILWIILYLTFGITLLTNFWTTLIISIVACLPVHYALYSSENPWVVGMAAGMLAFVLVFVFMGYYALEVYPEMVFD